MLGKHAIRAATWLYFTLSRKMAKIDVKMNAFFLKTIFSFPYGFISVCFLSLSVYIRKEIYYRDVDCYSIRDFDDFSSSTIWWWWARVTTTNQSRISFSFHPRRSTRLPNFPTSSLNCRRRRRRGRRTSSRRVITSICEAYKITEINDTFFDDWWT